MFKISYDAGHYRYTSGKRLPKELDKNETREWILNDRVARYFAEAAKQYEGVETLRVDDPTGYNLIELDERADKANKWGSNFHLSIHFNAAGFVFNGGGIVAYVLAKGGQAEVFQKAIYNACIKAGGLKGNRSEPLATANFQILRDTKAPAVLMEYGFMDSKSDAPVILTDAYARLVAYATMEGIAQVKGLKKTEKPVQKPAVEAESDVLYRVQVGAYSKKSSADTALQKVKAAGFDAYMVTVDGLYKVQVGAYRIKANAEGMKKLVTKKTGMDAFVTSRSGNAVSAKKSVEEIAKEVILGKWGNGEERKKKLTAAGYDPDEVQKMVNKLL